MYTDERIEKKLNLIKELDIVYEMTLDLYQSMTAQYKDLYVTNKAKVNSTHISGFSSIINSLTANRKEKSDLLDDIARIEDIENAPEEILPEEVSGNKNDILNLIKDGTGG